MNSRERLLAAINLQEPDMVPIDMGVTTVTGIGEKAYDQLLQFLGMEPEINHNVAHIHQGLVYPREEVYRHYQVDARPVYMKKAPRGSVVKVVSEDSFIDEFNMLWKKCIYDYAPINSPMVDYTSIEELNQYVWPDPHDPERVKGLKEQAKHLYENTDYAVVADIMCRGPFESAVKLRGYEQLLTDFYLEPEFTEKLFNTITENIIELWGVYLDDVGEYAQVVCQGDDLGSQSALIMGPELYRKFIKPCHKRIYDFIHSKTRAKVFMHSCGAIFDIIPDLIEVGVNILNPIQKSARNMDVVTLKKHFGKDICFWGGGIDVQHTLSSGSLDEIEDEIKRTIEVMAVGGGYVFAPTHNIHADVTSEKINKVYEAILKYRKL